MIRSPSFAWALGLLLVASGCADGSSTGPGTLRFGQIGNVQVRLEVPKHLGAGALVQTIFWSSDGPYVVEESIGYEGVQGDRTAHEQFLNREVLAGSYAQWIAQVNEVPALRLFTEALDPALDPPCGQAEARLTLEIRDDVREEEVAWTRCVDAGELANLQPARSGPDPAAPRVATAAMLLRDYTVGEAFESAYRATAPFATVDRGEGSLASLPRSQVIENESTWTAFWSEHTGSDAQPPAVDFERDVVLVGAVGVRQEAGDSVEIRRVLPAGDRTVVELFERVPGDFCSPAARTQTPFHIVRTPRVPLPVFFSDVQVERVPCGQ